MSEVDRIGSIFEGKTVFISGATGFLGKVLIEKLLRVTEVKTLYLLIRQKKGKSPKDRLQDISNSILFSKLRKERPEVLKKCILITGDVLEPNLGLIEIERQTVIDETDYIFHSAATTRFDETVTHSVKLNTLGTRYMLELAKQCKKLKLFVHISTAFAFPNEKILYEKTYDPPVNPNELITKIMSYNGVMPKDFDKKILKTCPNTYTFSKALAEDLVRQQMDKLPIIIVRPAVVIPTWSEPISGFFNNLQSPMGIFVGAGKGVIRSVYIDSKTNANLVPADCTINAMLVASWDFITTGRKNVFNICLPKEDLRISWEEIIEIGKEVIHTRTPFNQLVWYPGGTMTKSKVYHNFNVLFFQIIPAFILDLFLVCLGYKAVLFGINQRLLKGQEMFEYYTTRPWNFNVDYFLNLRRKLNGVERKKYKIDAEDVDIPQYLSNCILYARRHIFHETDEMLPAAKRNMKLFFLLDRIVKIGFFCVMLYYIYMFIYKK